MSLPAGERRGRLRDTAWWRRSRPLRLGVAIALLAASLAPASAAEEPCGRVDGLRRVSARGQEAALFRRAIEIWEETRGALPETAAVLRSFGLCAERLDELADQGQASPVSGLIWSVSEQKQRLSAGFAGGPRREYGTTGRLGRLSRRVTSGLLDDAAADGELANTIWFLWLTSLLEAGGERYDSYDCVDELALRRAWRRGKSFAIGFDPVFSEGKTLLGEIHDERMVQQGLVAGAVVTGLDGHAVESLERWELAEFWHRSEPFAYSIEGLSGGDPFRFEGRSIPRRHRTLALAVRNGVAYLRIRNFAADSMIEMRRALRTARSQDVSRLVLDLRHNPGGALSAGLVDIFFKPGQTLVSYLPRGESEPVNIEATVEYVGLPIVALVDRQSASMAEVLAAALKIHGRGLLVGETTFGKSVGQTTYPVLDEGDLHLVEREYFYPGTREGWGGGIQPDVEMELSDEQIETIRGFLENPIIRLDEQLDGDPVLRRAFELTTETR